MTDPGIQPIHAALEQELDADHQVFACPCGDWHCTQDPGVHQCADSGPLDTIHHCETWDCLACANEDAQEFAAEQQRDIRLFGP